MRLKNLIEVIFRTFQDGREKATEQTITKADIGQHVKASLGKMLYVQYYQSRREDEFLEADYSFYSQLLSKQPFELGDADYLGERVINLEQFQLYDLPKNKHIVNMTMVASGCEQTTGGKVSGNVTQISPGEENFYVYNAKYANFKFFRPTAKSISTWNIPPCVKTVIVESTFDSDYLEISFEIAFDIANHVLGVILGIPDYIGKTVDDRYDAPRKLLRKNLQQTQQENQL